ncbi:hypothetical protein [Streptomyces sp. MI02-7b]|uniref:hypothetical protein n=1 Tax=Streptomyces sp. MI02-7b TaxID=462941 RepID=UPI0029AE1AF5|nr:hypothetical protein [Streptomyces sp. MI02-7b]MDX3072864.1 hypothetical protein [Streptomyces sp. MI02-7b]
MTERVARRGGGFIGAATAPAVDGPALPGPSSVPGPPTPGRAGIGASCAFTGHAAAFAALGADEALLHCWSPDPDQAAPPPQRGRASIIEV